MGYMLRVRLASFFAGAAVASTAALYLLYQDYEFAHHSISHQMERLHNSVDKRVSALEKLKQGDGSQLVETTE